MQQDLSLLHSLEELVGAVEAELGRLSTCEPWVKQVPFLIQLPGLGVLSVMSILAAIGDITRFPSAKKLVGYAGLGASVHDSGERPPHLTLYAVGVFKLAKVLVILTTVFYTDKQRLLKVG